jgi:adenine-specific DNA-methyltransferase
MPTLQFKGKNIIWNHHLSVPYHTLDEVKKLNYQPEKANGNLIIEGDNLLALKALLPQYAGKVKCIYIDPPYNTGNEGWVYNDNVNSPMLKEWLGKEVGKDDLTRHDKWLCMMVPRLKLLRELLADDGAIFISIDYNEEANLRLLMDAIYGEENYRNTFVTARVKKNIQEKEKVRAVNFGYNSVIFYAKSDKCLIDPPLKFQKKPERWHAFDAPGIRSTMEYDLFGQRPPKGRHWMYSENNVRDMIEKGTLRKNPKTGSIQYLLEASDFTLLDTNWTDIQEYATEWNFPYGEKNIELIKRIIKMFKSERNALILDSFAGSGTTKHAVMDLNKEDGGNRKCILVQMTEATAAEPEKNICKDITRERVKRAVDKFGYDSGFRYFKVGIPIDAETLLSGNLPTYRQFAEYVYYLCTGESLKNKSAVNEKTYFVGERGSSVIYLVYKQNFDELTSMALNLSLAEKITAENPKKKVIVYAPACFLEEDYMNEKHIDYVGIPYNLFKREEPGGRS